MVAIQFPDQSSVSNCLSGRSGSGRAFTNGSGETLPVDPVFFLGFAVAFVVGRVQVGVRARQ
jgi:hypothetical protein